MKPKNKKSVLILNIILLLIFVPLAIIGTMTHFKNSPKSKVSNNTNKEFSYDGKLYFYDYNDLLGTYECKNDLCDYAYSIDDDKGYDLNYLKSDPTQIKMINNKYAFLMDTTSQEANSSYDNVDVIVYDIVNGRELSKVKGVKNYGVGIDNDYYIVKNDSEMWGVLQIADTIKSVIPYSFKYIGLHKNLANNSDKVESDLFVALDDSGWKIINNLGVETSKVFTNPIYDYNSNYVITKNNNMYYLNNLEGQLVVSFGYKGIMFMGKYVGVLSSSNEFYVIDPISTQDISQRYPIDTLDDVTFVINESGIELSIKGEIVETLN